MKNSKFILWLLIGMVLLSVFQQKDADRNDDVFLNQGEVGMATQKSEYRRGKEIKLSIRNNTESPLTLALGCGEEPFDVMKYEENEWVKRTVKDPVAVCENESGTLTLEPGKTTDVSYKNWAYRLFGDIGRYRIEAQIPLEDGRTLTMSSNEFTMAPRKTMGRLWINGIYAPILNGLIYFIKVSPGHSLGWGIILLTIAIRTLLLIPSQRAMKSQKKMQEVQKKIEALKKKHKDNQEKLALETVALWKEHKVNPFGSCMLMLIQFPILIALYYVIREGLHPDKIELIYPSMREGFFLEKMETHFWGLELLDMNLIVLPLIVGGLQFVQMHLAFARAKKKKETHEPTKKITKKTNDAPDMQDQMQMANNMMKYFLPAMIAFFTASLPAGVGLYWGVSTTYGIVQQLVVNKQQARSANDASPSVKVIEKQE